MRFGYEDREHATLAMVCAVGLAGAVQVAVVYLWQLAHSRRSRRRWSPLDWLSIASMALGVVGISALCVLGLVAAWRTEDQPPAWSSTVIAVALAALALSAAGVFVAWRRYEWPALMTTQDSKDV